MAGRLRWLHGALAGATTLLYKVARRLGVPYERFERHGWLPIPVHFYHPYPRSSELRARNHWTSRADLPGVDVDLDRAAALLEEIGRTFGSECDWPEHSDDPHVYHCANGNFGFTSAAVAHAMTRRFKPRRVVEVGSGYSTHILGGALSKNAEDGGPDADLISIEPHPGEILEPPIPHLREIRRQPVETVETGVFDALGENDLLFIDSSHVIRYGGDVTFLYLEVLPRLGAGVVVHIHDIHLPEPYPSVYFEQSRYVWNEQYLLQALLCRNRDFDVLLPCWALHRERGRAFSNAFAHYDPAKHRPGSSFWIRRTGTD